MSSCRALCQRPFAQGPLRKLLGLRAGRPARRLVGTLAWLALVAAWCAPARGQMRIWTDASGHERMEAELVGLRDGVVTLRRADGTLVQMNEEEFVRAFSEADRNYVAQRVFRQRREETRATEQQGHARAASAPEPLRYAKARRLCYLADERVSESSGLACSRLRGGVFWTHNDSGDDARLYAFDTRGRNLGACVLRGVLAFDWEDMASLSFQGRRYLLIGDIGNNGRAAAVHMIYLVEEPPLDPRKPGSLVQVRVLQLIHFAYEDDHRNCEALAIDPASRTILLATKEPLFGCRVYSLAWPKNDPNKVSVARQIATLRIPPVTAMDISPDGQRAVVLTYGSAYQYTRAPGEPWARAFARQGEEIVLPDRAQGEAVCYGPDGRTLYLTSEKLPTPLFEVPVAEAYAEPAQPHQDEAP